MRGVIMSVEGSKAVLLTQGGDFKQIRNKGYNIGDKVKVRANYAARIGSIAAALAVFAIGGGASYFIPASYVSVDINPSFLMTLNIYDKVINIEPLNGEAQTVLKHTDIKGKNINDTVDMLINESKQKGYINDNGGEVIVSVVPSIKTPRIEDKNTKDNINLVIGEADKTEYDEAKDMGVSIAKAKAIEEYTDEFGGTVSSNADKLSGMTVKQIKTEIEDKKELEATPAPVSAQSEKSQINSNPIAPSAPQPAAKATPKATAAPAQSFNTPQLFSSEPSNGGANGNNNAAEQKHEDNKSEVKQDNPQPKNNNENTNSQNITEEPRRTETPNTSAPMKPDEAPSEAKQPGGMPTGNSQGEPAKTGNELPEPKQENNAPASNPQQAGEPSNDEPKDNEPKDNAPTEKNTPSNDGGNTSSQTAPNGGNALSNAGVSPSQGGAPGGGAPAGGNGGGSQGGGPSGGGNGGGPR